MAATMMRINGVDLCVEAFGAQDAPVILLISGASASMDWWDARFCRRLAAGGRRVVRYDLRDTGRSVSYPPGAPGYSGPDLAEDIAGLIDALAGGRAHLAGISMGGALAQVLAVEHPERVATLTLMSTTSGPADDLPAPSERFLAACADLPAEPDWSEHDAVVEYLVAGQRPYAGPGLFDQDAARAVVREVLARTRSPESAAKNHYLLADGPDLRPRLGRITAPTLVIHGTEDPLFPPGHGRALAREIPGASLLLLDGVGHQVPPPGTWDRVIPALLAHTAPQTAG